MIPVIVQVTSLGSFWLQPAVGVQVGGISGRDWVERFLPSSVSLYWASHSRCQ